MKSRILIVDDHLAFRDGLKAVINHQADMAVIGEAEDGEKAVAMTASFSRISSSWMSKCRS
jgi:DNA-binding NarL/FixJ family response regulator